MWVFNSFVDEHFATSHNRIAWFIPRYPVTHYGTEIIQSAVCPLLMVRVAASIAPSRKLQAGAVVTIIAIVAFAGLGASLLTLGESSRAETPLWFLMAMCVLSICSAGYGLHIEHQEDTKRLLEPAKTAT